MNQSANLEIRHNMLDSRFELLLEGECAVLEYSLKKDVIIFTHTGVPPALEGRGIGSQLARAGLDYARENGLKVVPICSFVATYIDRHPEYKPLLAPE